MYKAIKVQTFNHKVFGEIRAGEVDGNPRFVGIDLASALAYKRPTDALIAHDPENHRFVMKLDEADNSTVNHSSIPQTKKRGNPNRIMVDEDGMYRLVIYSRLPATDDFVEWMTADVLPTLRKGCLSFR